MAPPTARVEAVSEGVTAVVGSFNFSPDAMIEVLEPAGIAYFGECCALGAKENTSKAAFPFGSIQMYGVGEVKKAVEDGCKKIKGLIIEGAESFWPPMLEAAKRLGAEDKLDPEYVTQPGTVQDQSAQVAQLLEGGTDCVVSVTSETPLTAFMVAWDAAQPTAKFYGPQGNLNKISAKGHEEILEGSTVVGVYPDLACPAWDDYRASLEAIGADPAQDYNSLGGLGTWAAYMGFDQVAESLGDTPVDAAVLPRGGQHGEDRPAWHAAAAGLHPGVGRVPGPASHGEPVGRVLADPER